MTSLAVSGDDKFVCFADKFGVVYVVDIGDYDEDNRAAVQKKAVPILSHYCSIITRLVCHFVCDLFVSIYHYLMVLVISDVYVVTHQYICYLSLLLSYYGLPQYGIDSHFMYHSHLYVVQSLSSWSHVELNLLGATYLTLSL